MSCATSLRRELNKIKKTMAYKDGTEILLGMSMVSDEMVHHVQMFQEIFVMDFTYKANAQRRDLFLMAIKYANGK